MILASLVKWFLKMDLHSKYIRELAEVQAKLDALGDFPDLQENKDRWGIIRLFGKSINSQVTHIEIKPTCDCCNNAAINCYPFIFYKGIQMFGYEAISQKPFFIIGKKVRGVASYNGNWSETMFSQGIPDAIINRIWDHIDREEEGEA